MKRAPWRTSTVVQLCQAMREVRDYSSLPILADALQDADFPHEDILEQMRTVKEQIPAERLVAMVYSDASAKAVKWMEQFVRDINYDEYKRDENGDWIEGTGKQSNTDPHDYSYIIEQGYVGCGLEQASGGWGEDVSNMMYFATDAGADYFKESEANVMKFFLNWSLITGVIVSDEDLKKVSYRCAC